MKPTDLYATPNRLAGYYRKFDVTGRVLLTGHSHQAWPDCGYRGQCQAWLDAAAHVDDKWDLAFAKAARVRQGFARLLDDTTGHITLAASTHELVVRFLSALPLDTRPRLVTTEGEFHTIRRQLDRLAEERIEIVKVATHPASSVAERLIDAVNDRTAAVMASTVFFEDARIVTGLGDVLVACQEVGVPLLVDAYHALDAIPFSVKRERLEDAFVVGGGYKYCQLGEGNCFLRFPRACELRPVITGWFSEFGALTPATVRSTVEYGSGPNRFAGATYDPTSHYRAAEVFDFFEEHALTPEFLREVSQHQISVLAEAVDRLDADPHVLSRDQSTDLSEIGGFLALKVPRARELVGLLRQRGVFVDARGDRLRFGPAPYLSDEQLTTGVAALGEILASWESAANTEGNAGHCR